MAEHRAPHRDVGDRTVDAPPRRRAEPAAAPRAVTSDALLAGASELAIHHGDTVYYLRQTRLGKLILTK